MNTKQILAVSLIIAGIGKSACAMKELQKEEIADLEQELIKAAESGKSERACCTRCRCQCSDEKGSTALIRAAIYGDKDEQQTIIKTLLAIPTININAKNNNGHSALLQAAYSNHTKTISLLLNHMQRDRQMLTSLHREQSSYFNGLPADVITIVAHYVPVHSISDEEAGKVLKERDTWVRSDINKLIRTILKERAKNLTP